MLIENFIELLNKCETEFDLKQLYKILPTFGGKRISMERLKDIKNNGLNFNEYECHNPRCHNLKYWKNNYCCNECCRSDEEVRNKIKQSWSYGKEERCQHMRDANKKRDKEFYQKRKEKYVKTMLERYGVESNSKLETAREAIKNRAIERWNNKTEKEKQEFAQKMKVVNTGRPGVNIYAGKTEEQLNEMKRKQYETKKRNHSFNSSVPEDKIKNILIQKFPDFKYQYRSELYPFACDFYIPEFDLYIEFQGTWIHGKNGKTILGAYDKNNREHQKVLSIWQEKAKNSKFYEIAINVWTIRDPLKREIARKINLNWLEFFTMDEFMKWYNNI